MNCQKLAERIHQLQPELSPTDVARLCLLILINTTDIDSLADDEMLRKAWRNASFRIEAATDQHAAVTRELDEMCGDSPVQFTPEQIWALLRAVKVQSQMLELYTDEAALAT